MERKVVAREKLYDEVWAEPMTTVAKRYDVSSSFLARVCEQLAVPRPPRGYWARLAVGIQMDRPALPPPEPGALLEWARGGALPKTEPLTSKPRAARLAKPTAPAERRPKKHALLVDARGHFDKARPTHMFSEQYVRPYKRSLVDIYVSQDALARALEIANKLFFALEARGWRVLMAPPRAGYVHVPAEPKEGHAKPRDGYYGSNQWTPAQPTLVIVDDVAFGLTLYEVSEHVDSRWDATLERSVRVPPPKPVVTRARGRHVLPPQPSAWSTKSWLPSGRLGLHAYAPHHGISWERYWDEKAKGDFEGLFETIATDLQKATPVLAKLREEKARKDEEDRRRYEREHEEWRRKEAERVAKEREAQREKDLVEALGRWRMARDIRSYVAEVRAVVAAADLEVTAGGAGDQELAWALAHADRIDPLTPWREEVARVRAAAAPSTPPVPEDAGQPVAAPEGGSAAPERTCNEGGDVSDGTEGKEKGPGATPPATAS